jgi:hypothetical protein
MPRMHGALGRWHALTGQRARCLEILKKLKELAGSRYVSPMEFASLHFALEQDDAGFEWLGKACQDRCLELLCVNVDPRFGRQRQDPRFALVMRQMGLATSASGRSARAQ